MTGCLPNHIAIWIVRECARPAAQSLAGRIGATVHPAYFPDGDDPGRNRQAFAEAFPKFKSWVLFMAGGIATRYLAGLPANKLTDPAVVIMDEALRFAIPILGGHEGGANALAYELARQTGATPVITTATEALKPLTIGIGCRKGMGAARIESAVQRALTVAEADISSVREAATVDIKALEPGLLEWIESRNIPLRVFSSRQLSDRPLTATPSHWVRTNTGLAGVCEPCALLASPRGTLRVPKLATAGVTVAIVSDSHASLPYLL